jgi:DNA-binding YbaB/EbfC family protein
MANMNQMLRQAQAMQRKMAKAQEELAEREVSGSAGGGMVTATASGAGELKTIEINPEAVDPDDVEMLQDMVTAAVNEALRAAKELEQEVMGDIAGGLGLPPGIV